jgi:hypothetical protein
MLNILKNNEPIGIRTPLLALIKNLNCIGVKAMTKNQNTNHSKLTQAELKNFLNYNRDTGIFTRTKTAGSTARIGDIAGSDNGNGYLVITINYKKYYAHRLAWLFIYGYLPENQIDHINQKRSDNRIKNLREISQTCNNINGKLRDDNTSGVKGISWNKRRSKWFVYLTINKKLVSLGYYSDFKEAVKKRWEAEQRYNFPSCNANSTAYGFLQTN